MYNYAEQKKRVITEDGINMLLAISKNIKTICAGSGACTIEKAINTVTGDSFLMLACIDYLEERGDITVHPHKGSQTQKFFITCTN